MVQQNYGKGIRKEFRTMVFSEQDFEILKEYEGNFYTAVNARYSRPLGMGAVDRIHKIYYNTTHDKSMEKINKGCGRCILNLLSSCGRLYFQDKDERNAQPKVVMNKKRQYKKKDAV